MKRNLRIAAFLDRDGTIIEDVPYNSDPEKVSLIPGSAPAVRKLNEAGLVVVITTNQSGIARGIVTEGDLEAVNTRMMDLLQKEGAMIDAVYYCPHLPFDMLGPDQTPCCCRKPEQGMVLRARDELGVDPARSYFFGDRQSDVEFARRAGGVACLLLTGVGEEELGRMGDIDGIVVADDLLSGVTRVLDEITRQS